RLKTKSAALNANSNFDELFKSLSVLPEFHLVMSSGETSSEAKESEAEHPSKHIETNMKQSGGQTSAYMKTVSVVSLTVQNSALVICMRYSRVRDVKLYIITVAVLMSEVVKCLASLFMVYRDEGDFHRWKRALRVEIIDNPVNTLKVALPSLIYVLQNNFYQVTYQLKILAAAMFTVTMLNRRLSPGIAIVQLSQEESRKDAGQIMEEGFFVGCDAYVWFLIVLQAVGGLIVAMVLKYADNILKGFATAIGIVFSCLASYFLFHVPLTGLFLLGAGIVIVSVFMYSGYPPPPPKSALQKAKESSNAATMA
ncbi:unnamed protein product, partial [Darwinula stevensoni]